MKNDAGIIGLDLKNVCKPSEIRRQPKIKKCSLNATPSSTDPTRRKIYKNSPKEIPA